MSEEKLYAVKEGKWYYWDFDGLGGFWKSNLSCPVTFSEDEAKQTVKEHGGHVVSLIEEPEKVVLTKEQAEIVENACYEEYPATYISGHAGDEEELLMNAYVNGYIVAKEKKYLVYKVLGGKQDKDNHMEYAQWCRSFYHPETMFWVLTNWIRNDQGAKFTEKEISDFCLQDCETKEVTDDEQ